MTIQLLVILWLLLAGVPAATAADGQPAAGRQPLVVSQDGPYTTIQAALDAAVDGDHIEVHSGLYHGPLVVEKSVQLTGVDWPVIDGGGQGTVVTLAAPDSALRGFVVQGSGVEPDRDHAGITLTAPRTVVENNRLQDVLFGIFVAQADDSLVRGNDVTSKPEYDSGRKGDGIRLWYSQRVIVEGNYVHDTRDVVLWYSNDLILRDNVIENGRYGIHLMYCDGAQIIRNHFANNSVGVYTMYSNNVVMQENLIRRQRGPSGYALGFKDADNVTVTDNVLTDNGGGIFLDGTPFSPQGFGRFQNNILAFNDIGVIMQPAVRGALFADNTFWENVEQVAVQGGGLLGENQWQGNFWSDYAGFDADGDGWGDVPYHAERFFEGLTDREPRLRVVLYSPAAQAIEFTARTFPLMRPQPKLTDEQPRMQAAELPAFALAPATSPWGIRLAAAGLLVLGLLCGLLAFGKLRLVNREHVIVNERPAPRRSPHSPFTLHQPPFTIQDSAMNETTTQCAPIQVTGVSKWYGRTQALSDVSFTAEAGEALALWGENGAGKTTLLKAILGLIAFQGDVQVEGHDVQRAGKLARRSIGYVPQEAVFYDWSVAATMAFYARLKKAPADRIPELLERLGLAEHAYKPVPALSGGLKQRLALAIALLADPPVLLLDEPTASLDAAARRDYLALLADLRRDGKTLIFASHRLEEVEALAGRVLLLQGGRLAAILSPEALRARLAPEVQLTLWVAEGQRPLALACLQEAGLPAHLNGRGTVVARVHNGQKAALLNRLHSEGIPVTDFEMEEVVKREA